MLASDVRTCKVRGSSPSTTFRVIGSATLLQATTFRNNSSYAAWYTMVECQPQTVEVLSNGYYVKWAFDGTVVGGNLDCRFGGVPFTGNQIDKELGRAEKHHHSPYAYEIPVGQSTYWNDTVHLDIDPALA